MADCDASAEVSTAGDESSFLVCDRDLGHDGLHFDDMDKIWWTTEEPRG